MHQVKFCLVTEMLSNSKVVTNSESKFLNKIVCLRNAVHSKIRTEKVINRD